MCPHARLKASGPLGCCRPSILPAQSAVFSPTIPRQSRSSPSIHIKDQDGAGSCATESTTQDEEVIEQFQGNKFVELNPWFVYYHTRAGDNGGSSHDENMAFIRANGVAPMSVWGRDKGWRRKPSEEAYEAAKAHRGREFYQVRRWEELGSCLIARKSCVVGWPGHSILAVRLRKDKKKLKIANSWGNWGDKGYGDMDKKDLVWGYGVYVWVTSIRHVA
jgi:hypothetical protein